MIGGSLWLLVIGIDPGSRGGISGLDGDRKTLWAIEMPTTMNPKNNKPEYNIKGIAALFRACKPDLICLEAVHSMPNQGVSSTFSFGKGFGILLGIIGTLDIPLKLVAPRVWKMKYLLSADKNISRQRASELYPECGQFWKLKKHDGLAEAAILAHFAHADDALDGVAPGDISQLYNIEVINSGQSKISRRNSTRTSSTKGNRPRNRSSKRVDLGAG